MRKSRAAIAALLYLGLGIPAASSAEAVRDRFDTVVLDAGHGGEEKGAHGPGGLVEKDLVLDVTRQLGEELLRRGIQVVMTRRDDSFVPLEQRTAIANDARGDLFVSIHANAADDPEVRGTETYFLSLQASDDSAMRVAERENRALRGSPGGPLLPADPLVAVLGDLIATEHVQGSSEFARLAQGELEQLDPRAARGVKQAPFVVLMGLQMPASLVEIGFITNPVDERSLRDARDRSRIVSALVRAVLEFGQRYDARRGIGTSARR